MVCALSQWMALYLGLHNGDIMAEKMVLDDDYTEKESDWDESAQENR